MSELAQDLFSSWFNNSVTPRSRTTRSHQTRLTSFLDNIESRNVSGNKVNMNKARSISRKYNSVFNNVSDSVKRSIHSDESQERFVTFVNHYVSMNVRDRMKFIQDTNGKANFILANTINNIRTKLNKPLSKVEGILISDLQRYIGNQDRLIDLSLSIEDEDHFPFRDMIDEEIPEIAGLDDITNMYLQGISSTYSIHKNNIDEISTNYDSFQDYRNMFIQYEPNRPLKMTIRIDFENG